MQKIASMAPRTGSLRADRVPNITGFMLSMAVAVPIWAGIIALVF
ncbi:hypothetical protein [Sphingomonas sp. CFBP 13720]|jgi:hypothetical protein|nr:hypothetical protein [Sphingomonas sp. CFBP 13720]